MTRLSSLILVVYAFGAQARSSSPSEVTKIASQNQQYHQDRLTVEKPKETASQNQQYHQERLNAEKPAKTASQNQQYHQDRLSVEKPTETASQNQQYHQERLNAEKPTKTASQNQQYHQDRLSVEKPTETASQNQQYHQERLNAEKPAKVANQNEQYHEQMLQLLQTTKGKTADARLQKYLKTYLAQVNGKAETERAKDVVKYGGCMIQRLYWRQKVADASQACAKAVPEVAFAHLEGCLAEDNKTTSRSCVTDAVKGELNVLASATSSPRVKFAEAETSSAN